MSEAFERVMVRGRMDLAVRRSCLRCGTEFYARKDRVKEGRGLYCCIRCARNAKSVPALAEILSETKRVGDCLELGGPYNSTGRPRRGYDGKYFLMSRLVYQLKHGVKALPKSTLVCHSCDNGKCVNPDHLWLGTTQDNVDDCIKKGRAAWQRKTTCSRGHPYDKTIRGRRICSTCERIRQENYRRKWGEG